MRFVLDLAYVIGLLLGSPWLIYKMVTTGKYRAGLGERLGFIRPRTGSARCLWVHGVSVGEVLAARTFIEEFLHRHADWEVVVSSTTNTGVAVARKTYPQRRVFYYPLDFSLAVARALGRIRPDLVVLLEADLWPNFLSALRRRGVPVVMVNNRITAASFRRQKLFGFLARRLYRPIVQITAQTERHARRLRKLGVPREKITVTGSLKYDSAPTRVEDPEGLSRELGLSPASRVLLAGSTFAPEEKVMLDIFSRLRPRFPDLRLVVVPRHKTRFEEVARLIRDAGFEVVRRSEGPRPAGTVHSGQAVVLGDTMGELTRFYGLAEVVFVGKSLVEGGGQNILEPAALARPVVFGPSIYNFQETADALLAQNGAVRVRDAAELERVLTELLADPEWARRVGESARRVIESGRGATRRNVDIVDKVLAAAGRA